MSSSTFYALGERALANIKKVLPGASHANDDEKLQRFVLAKRELGDIYEKLGRLIRIVLAIYDGIDEENRGNEIVHQMKGYLGSVKSIKLILLRDKMKVVFFGGTSNGKSTVANTMIGKKLLPSGVGTTTCCFLQVEGGDVTEAYFTTEESDKRMPIGELEKAGDALSDENEDLSTKGKDTLFEIVYPKAESKLLQNDVLIMDSPGIGFDSESDEWIHKRCADADLFVLVYNTNSMLSNVEKDFILMVKKRIASPNVFVLCNKWDLTDGMDEVRLQKLRQKHEKDMSMFFTKVDLSPPFDAGSMPFFVSGVEMLDVRCNGAKNESDRSQLRQKEFLRFENSFKQCISAAAINTKLDSRVKRAIEINGGMFLNINRLETKKVEQKNQEIALIGSMNKQQGDWKKKFDSIRKSYAMQLVDVRCMVTKEVSEGFKPIFEELDSGSFFKAFKCDIREGDQGIEFCKQQLISYIEEKCKPYMESRYTAELLTKVDDVKNSVFEQAKGIYGGQYDAVFNKCLVENKFSWASASTTCDISETMELRKPFDSERFRRALNCWDVFFKKCGKKLDGYLQHEYLPHLKSKLEKIRDDQVDKCEAQIIGELSKVFNAVEYVYDEIHGKNIAFVSAKLEAQHKMKKHLEEICAAKRLSVEIGHALNSYQTKHLQT